MSMFTLLPSADVAGKEETYATWENGFSDSEIANLINYGDSQIFVDATVGNNAVAPNVRKTAVAWLAHNTETNWLYDKLGYIVRQINGQFFNFDISGFAEDFQYTVYKGQDQSFYDWHMDKAFTLNGSAPRKLSLIVQLSDPGEYEGGELQFMTEAVPVEKPKTKGLVHIFPSWAMHRVTPVIRGTRKTLVVWVAGPKFR